eukprot:Nitzschia sp. Nitz4//scaffold148_size54725//52367//53995//NITZ4_006667-RA/size54725-processed-gene-0.81-mRNA-1//1//CDS//3329536775//6103//frame0
MTIPMPTNALVSALLTDTYQITMSYAHWVSGKHNEPATFELFFRKNPFKGQFTIFCGLDEAIKYMNNFRFTPEDIAYLKSTPSLAPCEPEFFDYLAQLSIDQVTCIRAMPEGTVAFPRVPLIIVEAPLVLGQLLETTLLNLINFPSLVATNAARMVLRAAPAPCIEFGLRRAQGPDGACSASKYSYLGGFVGTSNVQAGKEFGIPISGTQAHSFVQSFTSLEEVESMTLFHQEKQVKEPFLPAVLKHRTTSLSNDGELAAFVAYACAFPHSCLCLIDTYNTLQSGLPNFLCVAVALVEFGYVPKGIRLDSGDLASLSVACKEAFDHLQEIHKPPIQLFSKMSIVVSNDVNEAVLQELAEQTHNITAYGIGTNLVTCQAQPALGCVYKLVEWNGKPRIKISQELVKVTIPGRKRIFRLYAKDETTPLVDLMILADEPIPVKGEAVTCRNPFEQGERVQVTASRVEELHRVVIGKGAPDAFENTVMPVPDLANTRSYIQKQLSSLPDEVTRYSNPQPYRVMVSPKLFVYMRQLWESEAPVPQLS